MQSVAVISPTDAHSSPTEAEQLGNQITELCRHHHHLVHEGGFAGERIDWQMAVSALFPYR